MILTTPMNKQTHSLVYACLTTLLFASAPVSAERISDIANTKHNLSTSSSGSTLATSEDEICVFCHTPHKAEAFAQSPLWNRKLSGATYTPYTSSSINANDIAATPGGSSKLCLSCHDGTIAIGQVNVLNAQLNTTNIAMQGTGAGGVMPSGSGDNTGFTRKLGIDLTNDHPISFTYDTALASADGELRDPSSVSHIANRDHSQGIKPSVPLEANKMQCTSCHDPHIRDTDPSVNAKFLRLNRFQEATPAGGAFSEANDIVCLACHDKLGQAWSQSAHADPTAANETYSAAAAALREFPANQPVWKASCLNCHDTHTVQGSRRLLREGTDSTSSPKTGGSAALEEACYTCHSSDGGVLTGQGGAGFEVPNVKTDFTSARRMPITTADQAGSSETHDVLDADLLESTTKLNNSNRHVECTDCHNPHRVTKNRLFNATGSTVAGTHDHSSGHTNIASGVLRGSWGVEPSYGSANFNPNILPTLYTVKKGDGGTGASTDVNSSHVTREYQICLKCHSDYAYGTTPPSLGDTSGGTPSGTNLLTKYTNQAMEFQAPTLHQGGPSSTTDSGASSSYQSNNYRSWHPVMKATGRTGTVRGNSAVADAWRTPFKGTANVGTQTMYCSDCHGSDTASDTVAPNGGENGNPWGPHGSSNNFILKGAWNTSSKTLCLKCHEPSVYNSEGGDSNRTGFWGGGKSNLHAYHIKRVGTLSCNWCHAAVPHGFKNKMLLVNLRDVGPEAGFPTTGNDVGNGPYNKEPYYMNAMLRVSNFRPSGSWSDSDCGGVDWMKNNCDSPP